jgi:serine/threonine protein kinase
VNLPFGRGFVDGVLFCFPFMQRVDEGISEDEAWRLFQQIVDALAHMSTLNILHRDIKLTNIFIGAFCAMMHLRRT